MTNSPNRGVNHRKKNSDIIVTTKMFSADTSTYDNVDSEYEKFLRSRACWTISDLMNIRTTTHLKFFCPLCVHDFDYTFLLFVHLKKFHSSFMDETGDKLLNLIECPFCDGRFYSKLLTAKHALVHHPKLIKRYFVRDENAPKCCFCNRKFGNGMRVVKHIEKIHLFDFEEAFNEKFISNDTNTTNQKDAGLDTSQEHQSPVMRSTVKDFKEASKLNCYDFTDLKEQLEKIKNFQIVSPLDSNLTKKSVLKDVTNTKHNLAPHKSVRRVLRFDLPEGKHTNDKENSVLEQNLCGLKQINPDEHSLLCQNTKDERGKISSDVMECAEPWCEIPRHSSTPNSKCNSARNKILSKDECDTKKSECNFKLYLHSNNKFKFQCGKCKKLFQQNLDLVRHVKQNHKRLALKPCFKCAICSARFYKNYYLKKHHNLHNRN